LSCGSSDDNSPARDNTAAQHRPQKWSSKTPNCRSAACGIRETNGLGNRCSVLGPSGSQLGAGRHQRLTAQATTYQLLQSDVQPTEARARRAAVDRRSANGCRPAPGTGLCQMVPTTRRALPEHSAIPALRAPVPVPVPVVWIERWPGATIAPLPRSGSSDAALHRIIGPLRLALR
jgi:hypothetical protein